jgi:DNA modification methylase
MNFKTDLPYLPTSVIKLNRTKKQQDLKSDRKSNDNLDKYAFNSSRNKLGNFRLDIAEFILKYYNEKKLSIYDPFSGWGERGLVAKNLGIDYMGVDISDEAINYTKINYNIDCLLGDSRKSIIKDNSYGFSYTCPPYFNIEKYKSCEGQLTDIKNYDNFLLELNTIIYETKRILKNNSYCVWVVGDFRIKNIFYDFSSDVINLFKNNKFKIFDKIVLDKSINYRIPMFLKQAYDNGYTVKLHEYILIFKLEKGDK